MYQISSKSSFDQDCPVFLGLAGNSGVREHERPVLVGKQTVALMHSIVTKTIEVPF